MSRVRVPLPTPQKEMRDRECPGPSSLSTQGCRQVVRQGTLTPSSAGSSPAIPATDDKDGPPSFLYASLAQSAEHLPFKQGVRGSNPRRGTKREPPFGWLSFVTAGFCKAKIRAANGGSRLNAQGKTGKGVPYTHSFSGGMRERGRQTCGQPQNPVSNARLFLRSRG